MDRDYEFLNRALARINLLGTFLTVAGLIAASVCGGWKWAIGFLLGAAASWINFRWLKGGVHAFGKAATEQAGSEAARVPKRAFVQFIGRFALLLVAVYVILTRSWVPPVAFFAGLFASAAGVVVALVYELLTSGVRQSVGKGL